MFKAIITEKETIMKGTTTERLAGLCCYVEALKKIGISQRTINKVVDIPFEENSGIKTILDDNNVKVQKIDLNNVSKEEAKAILNREIFDELFD